MKTEFNPWPCGILVFFALLFCGIATILVIAVTHRESMVSADYYEQELKFQSQIDSAARAEKSGAHIQLDAAAEKLRVTVPAAQLAQKFSGAIEFYRPSAPELDREYLFQPGADGQQALDVSQFAAGLWHVRVKWTAGGQDYFLEKRITI